MEITRFLAATTKKAPKARKPRAAAIKIGSPVSVHGRTCIVTRRDTRFANAWFVSFDGKEIPTSFSRDMISA